MKLDQIVKKLRAMQPTLMAEGVSHLAIVGSRARGEERPNSDLDVLLDIDGSVRFSLLNVIGVQHITKDATGIDANAFVRGSLRKDFRAAMEADAVQVF
jgi:uncharacterized protein